MFIIMCDFDNIVKLDILNGYKKIVCNDFGDFFEQIYTNEVN